MVWFDKTNDYASTLLKAVVWFPFGFIIRQSDFRTFELLRSSCSKVKPGPGHLSPSPRPTPRTREQCMFDIYGNLNSYCVIQPTFIVDCGTIFDRAKHQGCGVVWAGVHSGNTYIVKEYEEIAECVQGELNIKDILVSRALPNITSC